MIIEEIGITEYFTKEACEFLDLNSIYITPIYYFKQDKLCLEGVGLTQKEGLLSFIENVKEAIKLYEKPNKILGERAKKNYELCKKIIEEFEKING